MKKQWIISIVLVAWAMLGCAQNIEDEFNAFVRQNEQSFNRFADSINRVFAEAMEANMRSFTGEKPKVKDPKPKPDKQPEIVQEEVPEVPQGLMPEPSVEEPKKAPEVSPVDNAPATPPSENLNVLEFELFGEAFHVAAKPFPQRLDGITARDVSRFWVQLSESDYDDLLQKCRKARSESGFNDWATFRLAAQMAAETYPMQYNEQVVMTIFLLNQLGMEAKVGFSKAHLFCLVAVAQQIYGVSFADISNHRYYTMELNPDYRKQNGAVSFQTYDVPFPKKTEALDMNIAKPLKSSDFPDLVDSAINISLSMIELYKTYPQVDIEVYANARPSSVFCRSVEEAFKPYLHGLTEVEAVAFLLVYLQYAFDYATDDEQFGYEKPFFCEENFYYPQNDCEDRSVLFSFLVRHLLHLDVVLIDYPGHIATAVHFDDDVPGAAVMYKGKRYVICDPTYIGAPVGREMPDFTPSDRTVVPLERW